MSLFAPLLLLAPLRNYTPEKLARAGTPPLTVVTLSYGHTLRNNDIAHNCAMISKGRHRYVIFTDDITPSYCNVCECRKFELRGCPCPEGHGGCNVKNPCEKLLFFTEAVEEFREMVFLDDDLVILKDYFLDRLAVRAQAHDFLATYGHTESTDGVKYVRNFNSGLVFIRWIPGLDYGRMERRMYEVQAMNDQGIISWFVQSYYTNWDVLSWKWHCRLLHKLKQDMPPEVCYTLHDRLEMELVLGELNFTRLTLP